MFAPTQKRDAVALFAANMRALRKAKKLTQEQVAEGSDLHPNYISSVERAERNISIRNIERIAAALDVNMAELLRDHEAHLSLSPPPPQDADIGHPEREAVDAFLRLPSAQRKVIRDVVLTYLRDCSANGQV
jgi:transcriptional regulator with XRE-family HTH domain